MSLRARLRLSIVALVAIVVVAISLLYLYDFTEMAFKSATARGYHIAYPLLFLVYYIMFFRRKSSDKPSPRPGPPGTFSIPPRTTGGFVAAIPSRR